MPKLQDFDVVKDDGGQPGTGCTPIKGTSVRLIDDDGRHVFDIRVSEHGDLEIQTLNITRIVVYPEVSNVVRISTELRE